MGVNFYTKSGLLVAHNYVRIVHGDRGSYLEFEPEHICHDHISIPKDQEWRLEDKWKNEVFYDEYRTVDASNVKLYFQRKYVGYADYNLGMYYISLHDLYTDDQGANPASISLPSGA
jgi:hypothetical protein